MKSEFTVLNLCGNLVNDRILRNYKTVQNRGLLPEEINPDEFSDGAKRLTRKTEEAGMIEEPLLPTVAVVTDISSEHYPSKELVDRADQNEILLPTGMNVRRTFQTQA